ncbi:hypothetical protein C8J57DRAFT_1235708 [Mycena rebaudengoi]|nr:hypothetical protein C8J57DRAFT_1235708 [Mycena rebaudengoi]
MDIALPPPGLTKKRGQALVSLEGRGRDSEREESGRRDAPGSGHVPCMATEWLGHTHRICRHRHNADAGRLPRSYIWRERNVGPATLLPFWDLWTSAGDHARDVPCLNADANMVLGQRFTTIVRHPETEFYMTSQPATFEFVHTAVPAPAPHPTPASGRSQRVRWAPYDAETASRKSKPTVTPRSVASDIPLDKLRVSADQHAALEKMYRPSGISSTSGALADHLFTLNDDDQLHASAINMTTHITKANCSEAQTPAALAKQRP